MIKNIKVGVIGLGVGEAHIKSYKKIKNLEIKSICDFDTRRLKYISKKYKISNTYTDSLKITEDPEIDLYLYVLLTTIILNNYFLLLNGKHVMVEKPVVLYKREAEKVIKAWKDSKCKITSNLILRQSPRFIKLKKLIKKNYFGKIYHVEGDYIHFILHKIISGWRGKMPFYSTVYGGGIHLIDLMRWIIEEEVLEVSSIGNDLLTKNSHYKYPETICSLLKFQNDITGRTMTTFGPKSTKFQSLNIDGSKKTFINHTDNAEIYSGDKVTDKTKDTSKYPGFEKGDLLPDFVKSIRNNKNHEVSGIDIFRVMDVCFAIWEAYKKRKTIKISYLI